MAYKDKQQMYDYNNEFQRKTYDRIQLIPVKIDGEKIRAAAAVAGQTVSAYCLQAVRERMQREQQT